MPLRPLSAVLRSVTFGSFVAVCEGEEEEEARLQVTRR